VDLCSFSFALVGVHAIEASTRFGGVVAGMHVYLLAARPWIVSRFVLRRPCSFQAPKDSGQRVVRMGARKDDFESAGRQASSHGGSLGGSCQRPTREDMPAY
jgi:hypothetical protein